MNLGKSIALSDVHLLIVTVTIYNLLPCGRVKIPSRDKSGTFGNSQNGVIVCGWKSHFPTV